MIVLPVQPCRAEIDYLAFLGLYTHNLLARVIDPVRSRAIHSKTPLYRKPSVLREAHGYTIILRYEGQGLVEVWCDMMDQISGMPVPLGSAGPVVG